MFLSKGIAHGLCGLAQQGFGGRSAPLIGTGYANGTLGLDGVFALARGSGYFRSLGRKYFLYLFGHQTGAQHAHTRQQQGIAVWRGAAQGVAFFAALTQTVHKANFKGLNCGLAQAGRQGFAVAQARFDQRKVAARA